MIKIAYTLKPIGFIPATFTDWRNHIRNECVKAQIERDNPEIIKYRKLPVNWIKAEQ